MGVVMGVIKEVPSGMSLVGFHKGGTQGVLRGGISAGAIPWEAARPGESNTSGLQPLLSPLAGMP